MGFFLDVLAVCMSLSLRVLASMTCKFWSNCQSVFFSPSMMMLLVSEVPEEAVQPHDSHGAEHKEVGLPPTQALLGQVHKLRSTVLNLEATVGF